MGPGGRCHRGCIPRRSDTAWLLLWSVSYSVLLCHKNLSKRPQTRNLGSECPTAMTTINIKAWNRYSAAVERVRLVAIVDALQMMRVSARAWDWARGGELYIPKKSFLLGLLRYRICGRIQCPGPTQSNSSTRRDTWSPTKPMFRARLVS